MKCIMPLLVILLISVCTKAQDFNDANYEYHTLDSLSIKNTDLKNILTKYQYCEMEMPYYPDYIIIIKFKDNNNKKKKGRNSDVYLQIESINVRDLKFEEFCGFFYVYETWESKRLVLVKYENNDSNSNNISKLGDRTMSIYKILRTGLLELTGETRLARFRRAKYGEDKKQDRTYSSCVFEYNMDTKMFKFLWRQFYLGR